MTITDRARSVVAQMVNYQRDKVPITVRAADAPLPVTASKFGGVPYLPVGAEIPRHASGELLSLLAQINCAELPKNNIYPPKGIVQFWISGTDGMMGLDWDNPISQVGSRVIYYPTLGQARTDIPETPIDWHENGWPWGVAGEEGNYEYALSFKDVSGAPWQFYAPEGDQRFIDRWNDTYPEWQLTELWDLDNLGDNDAAIVDTLLDEAGKAAEEFHQLGGKPIFVQNDPREEHRALRDYTVNLLTVVSTTGPDEIMWGDMGTANWLITPEQLAERDFSKVLYEWSCS